MTIAQSLEHSWIKVRQWGCPHVGMAGVSSLWHGGGVPRGAGPDGVGRGVCMDVVSEPSHGDAGWSPRPLCT